MIAHPHVDVVIKVKENVVMFVLRSVLIGKIKTPGHAEVNDEGFVIIKMNEQIFGTSGYCFYALIDKVLRKVFGDGITQIFAVEFDVCDAQISDFLGETKADGLYFRKFRHIDKKLLKPSQNDS